MAPNTPADDDRSSLGARPDPLDRMWRHPSELPGRGPARPQPDRGRLGIGALIGIGTTGAVLGSLLTVGILGFSGLLSGDPKPTARDKFITVAKDDARQDAAAAVRPSIVEITYTGPNGPARGAGICIKRGGVILTSEAVVGAAKSLLVTDSQGLTTRAKVIGRDPVSGLALLDTGTDIPVASLAQKAPTASQSVIVLGTGTTIGDGIVNATSIVATTRSGLALPNLLITSALPAQAEPGSALVDRQGKIAGIVLQPSLGALPIDYAREVIEQLENTGAASHAWLGFTTRNSAAGPRVVKVDPSSPAAVGGLKVGDLIDTIDERDVITDTDVEAMVEWRWALDDIAIVVKRKGNPVTLTLKAVAVPESVS